MMTRTPVILSLNHADRYRLAKLAKAQGLPPEEAACRLLHKGLQMADREIAVSKAGLQTV